MVAVTKSVQEPENVPTRKNSTFEPRNEEIETNLDIFLLFRVR